MNRIECLQLFERKVAPVAGATALFLSFAAAGLALGARQPATQPRASAAVSQATSQGVAVSRAHKDAAELVSLMGVRRQIEQNANASIQNGVDSMLRQFPNMDPRFVAEWKKRMVAELNPDDYVAVVVQVYEKHFSAAELEELTAAIRARQESKTPTLSPQLAEKLKASAVDVQIDVMAGCAKVGARVGEKVAQEIGKEHPDWMAKGNPAASRTAK